MPALIAILGIIAAVAFWLIRARTAASAATELVDMANDVRLAARRFGFRRQSGRHPVEGVDDPAVATAALAVAYLELDDLPSREQQIALHKTLQSSLNITLTDAEELTVLGHWLVNECGGSAPAVTRLSRKLFKLDGAGALPGLMQVIKSIAEQNDGKVSNGQAQALDDIKRAFRLT